MGEVIDVYSSCGYIGGDEEVDGSFFEFGDDFFSSGLFHISMESIGIVSSVLEVVGDFVYVVFCSTEYDSEESIFGIYDSTEGFEFIISGDLEVYLGD